MKNLIDRIKQYSKRFQTFSVLRIAGTARLKEDSLTYWRVRILFTIMLTSVTVGFLSFIALVPLVIEQDLWPLFIFDVAAWSLGLYLLLARGPSYKTRAGIALFMFYLIGVIVIFTVGVMSGGPAWLFAFAVLVGVLLGSRAAMIALAVNALTLVVISWLIHTGYFNQSISLFASTKNMIMAGASFMLLNSIAAMSVAVLVKGLLSAHQKERDLTNTLKKEHSQLVGLKNELEQEVLERKQTEEALRKSEQRYRLIADNVADIIWTMGMDLKLSYVSPSIHSMRGFTVAEAMQQDLDEVILPDSHETVMSLFMEKLALAESDNPKGYQPVYFEVAQYCKDGSVIQTGNMARFIPGPENKPVSILGVTRDITQQKQAEQALRESEEKLVRSKKMESLGLLAGGVAHDLNNVLSGIVSYPELLLLDLPEDSKFRGPIETIKESGHRATAIVQDLITVARGVAITREPLNVNDLVDDYLRSPEFSKLKQFHPEVQVKTDLNEKLFNINGSPIHLAKVLMNLVSNAAEALEGSGIVHISTRNQFMDRPLRGYEDITPGEYVILAVADDGPGISAEDLERIFEPFYTKKFMGRSGTGLGLAVVWNIMLDHKGYIDVKSNASGTNFELYFPITRDKALDKSLDTPLDTIKGAGEKVLVIDDVQSQREISTQMLQTLGYNAESVSSGEAALDYLKTEQVDLLLLDMIMDPGMNGRDTYERIIKIHPHQRAIIVSGFSETEDVRATQRLGAGQYIKKPITLEVLGLAVKNELAKDRQ